MTDPGLSSPHRNFADNLMALCQQHGSIAAVCRELEMNRQQFNKYLSGASLPNAATLERICSFFKIPAEVLFQDPRGFRGTNPLPDSPADEVLKRLPLAFLQNGARVLESIRHSTLRAGVYLLYYPWPRDPRMCARAAMLVTKSEGFTFFTRFTKFRILGLQQRYYLRGRHDGIALESEGSRFLFAANRKGFRDVSLLTFGIDNTLNQNLLSGLGLVMGATANPLALRAYLQYRGARDVLRKTIGEAGILPLTDSSVPGDIREVLSSAPGAPASTLNPLNLMSVLSVGLDRQMTEASALPPDTMKPATT